MTRALRPEAFCCLRLTRACNLSFRAAQNPDYLLETGELREASRVVWMFYRELRAGQGIASLVAKKRESRVEDKLS